MRDPYEILEVRKGASKDEIKSAYKKLAKQYHPDQYDNNPLKELAEDKMAEINEAYEYLMKQTNSNGYGSSTSSNSSNRSSYSSSQSNNNYSYNYNSSNNSSTSNSSDAYQSIRTDINSGNLSAAEKKLNSLPFKDAEWNYLMGLLYLRKGWYDSANNYIVTAYNLNPNNLEYKRAYNNLSTQNNSYRQNYYGRSSRDTDMCDLCTKLWCLDSMCECFGGDMIPCI